MSEKECLIETIRESNEGVWDAASYLESKLKAVSRRQLDGLPGSVAVDCDRCGAVFRFNPGGVYLELEGEQGCDRPDGAVTGRGSYQLNIDFSKID